MNKKAWIILILVLLVGIRTFFCTRKAQINDFPQLKEQGYLSVLIESGEHGIRDDSASLYGFQYQIIKSFADSVGLDLVVLNSKKKKRGTKQLKNGKCNVLLSLRPVLHDTTSSLRYLQPIITTRLMLAQKKDSTGRVRIRTQYELDQDTLTVMKDSPYLNRVHDLEDELAITIFVEEMTDLTLHDMIQLVAEGRNSYTICPEYLSRKLTHQYPEVDFRLPLSFLQEVSWMVHKEASALEHELNTYLTNFVGSAAYWKLYQTYFIEI